MCHKIQSDAEFVQSSVHENNIDAFQNGTKLHTCTGEKCTLDISTVSSWSSDVFSVLQLLLDCGLGGGGGSEGGTEAVVAQHRVLIFCQLKSMLDIVEHDLLKPKLPSVTYLRLDGSVQAGLRHSIVSRSVDWFIIKQVKPWVKILLAAFCEYELPPKSNRSLCFSSPSQI